MTKRIEKVFSQLREKNQKAFVTFVMAGDPDLETTLELMKSFPNLGVDILELGIPFTDPMADGPSIQRAGIRSLKNGTNLQEILKLVEKFRRFDTYTPVVLMGYFNPIYSYGVEKFLKDAKTFGVDGLIVVDLPPEEDIELCIPSRNYEIDFIRLSTPTSDKDRLAKILKNNSGFVYHVSITGTTGAGRVDIKELEPEIKLVREFTQLPVCVGFGIKTPEDAKNVSHIADGVVVGSAIIEKIEAGSSRKQTLEFVKSMANSVKS